MKLDISLQLRAHLQKMEDITFKGRKRNEKIRFFLKNLNTMPISFLHLFKYFENYDPITINYNLQEITNLSCHVSN